jgi:hypothetical protein
MWRTMGRACWWLVATERPSQAADYLAILALVGLAVSGALAIAWPWVSDEAPRLLATGVAVVNAAIDAWLKRLLESLPRIG